MEWSTQISLVFLALFLVLLNGLFVASEFSIVKVRSTRIQELVQQGNRSARRAEPLLLQMDEYLSATQLGITLASLGLGWVGEPAFASLFRPLAEGLGVAGPVLSHSLAAGSAFALITFLHIVLGELAPKSLAIERSEGMLLRLAQPLTWFYRLSYPLIWALNGAARLSLALFRTRRGSAAPKGHSEEELRMILAHSHEKGFLDRDSRALLERVFDFADRSVRQVMVPSVEVVYLDIRKSLEENLRHAIVHGHTRFPLCDGSLDRVIGLVHIKELLWRYQQVGPTFSLESVQRPVQFVPESQLIRRLLAEIRRTRTHLAVVVDEYGASVGIVTLEDILEELVGEIQDEFEEEIAEPSIQKKGEGSFMVQGRALLEEVEQALGISIGDQENDTIAGHVMMSLGRMAHAGDQVAIPGGYLVRVVGMKGHQITHLVIEPAPGRETR